MLFFFVIFLLLFLTCESSYLVTTLYPLRNLNLVKNLFIFFNIAIRSLILSKFKAFCLVRNDNNIWGIFHSHPGEDNPIPSREDKVSAAFQEYKFLVGFNNKFFKIFENLTFLST